MQGCWKRGALVLSGLAACCAITIPACGKGLNTEPGCTLSDTWTKVDDYSLVAGQGSKPLAAAIAPDGTIG